MATKNGLPAIHPGEYLREILEELGMSQNAFALSIGISAMRVSHVIHGKRPVTAELAVLFGKAFSQTPQYWMNLQTSYDLKIAEKAMTRRVKQVRPVAMAA
jgi:addiction module HigA family antidote